MYSFEGSGKYIRLCECYIYVKIKLYYRIGLFLDSSIGVPHFGMTNMVLRKVSYINDYIVSHIFCFEVREVA